MEEISPILSKFKISKNKINKFYQIKVYFMIDNFV
jgi:hypothetical protein